MANKHFSYADVVSNMAENQWGASHDTMEAAEKDLSGQPDRIVAFAALELLNRFNKFLRFMAWSGLAPPSKRMIEKPADAKPFPDKAIGDCVWAGDMYDGFYPYVVTGKSPEDGSVLVALCDYDPKNPSVIGFATDYHYATLAEAVAVAAEKDVKYHGEQLAFARAALAAVEDGGDLSRFELGLAAEQENV